MGVNGGGVMGDIKGGVWCHGAFEVLTATDLDATCLIVHWIKLQLHEAAECCRYSEGKTTHIS